MSGLRHLYNVLVGNWLAERRLRAYLAQDEQELRRRVGVAHDRGGVGIEEEVLSPPKFFNVAELFNAIFNFSRPNTQERTILGEFMRHLVQRAGGNAQ